MKTQSTKMERVLSTLLVLAVLLLIGTFLVARSEYFDIAEMRRERAQVGRINGELQARIARSEQTIARAAQIVSNPAAACVGAVAGVLGLP